MKKKSLLAAALGTAALATTTASADTLRLTASDESGKSSFTTWNVSGGGTPAPSADNDYVVDNGWQIRFPDGKNVVYPNSGWVWPGNSLRIGTVGESDGKLITTCNTNATHRFNNGGLILAKGRIQSYVSNRNQIFSGTITVTAPESAPFDLMLSDTAQHPGQQYTISSLSGASGTAIRAYANTADNPATITVGTSSVENFRGTFILGTGDAKKTITCKTPYNKKMSGGFVVNKGATIAPPEDGKNWTVGSMDFRGGAFTPPGHNTKWTVGDMILDANSTIGFRISGANSSKFIVTDSLSAAAGVTLKFSGAPGESDTEARSWVIMTLPQEKGTIPVENFTLSGVPSFPSALPKYTLETNAVGNVWQLILKKSAHDFLKTNDDTGGYSAAADVSSAMTTGTSWAGGAAPSPGCDYVAQKDKGGLTAYPIIRTPYQNTPYVFPGDSLVLGSGGQLLSCSKEVEFPLLVLSANTTYILSLPGNDTHLRGSIQTVGGSDTYPQKIQAYMRGLNTVDADMSGNGAIWVTGRNSSTNPFGDIEFTALNTNFTGKIKVCAVGPTESSAANPPSNSDYRHERVFVTDARNLGGALDEFRADALELADYSVLEARNDVDLNVANRGVKVTGNAGFAAPENVTLAISNDVTWNGTARKTGAGTLALGGAPRIASGATALLEVQEGFLSVCATGAVNGVSVSFADGAFLLVDPAPADDDLASFGAVDLSPDPFGGELPVAFALPALAGESDSYRYSNVAVATVKDSATASKLNLSARKIKGHGVTFATRTNDDGTVTILASISQNAFVMVVR